MKILPLALGLIVFAAIAQLGAAPTTGHLRSTSPRSDSSVAATRGTGAAAPGPWLVPVAPEEVDSVEIVSISEQEPEANGRRKVTVRIKYALATYPKAILCLGFNLNSATRFSLVSDRWIQRGHAEAELSATIVPVVWPEARPFKVFVSLSAQPQPKQWSLLASVSQVMKIAAPPAGAR